MEDEIDLRPYIELLVRRWYLIVGAAVLAGVVAFVISSLLPPTYRATALAAITEPRLRVQFDPRFEQPEGETQPLKAFPELATSDVVLHELLESINPVLEEVTTLEALRGIVEAQSGSDPTLVRLSASFNDPDEAARIANTWARLFVNRANEIFGDQGEDQERFFVDQLAETEMELSAAEEALIDFHSINRESIIDNELASLQESQASYLADRRQIAFLLQDIKGLRDQLDGETDLQLSFSDQLTALSLQLRVFNASAAIPLQLQMETSELLTNRDRDQQVASLDSLITTLEARAELANEKLAELEPEILVLQEERQKLSTESSRLHRDRDVANETYMALARQVEEERISSVEISSVAGVASEASVPEKKVGPRRMFNTGIGVFLGLFAGVFVILIGAWWRKEREDQISIED